ncbi:serine/threonine-protein kinase [Streptosporangium saharense]|uniref:non-specific serine/threonine protein kinase n=1 Tax=Streptosporangium saharense TaxID=1706840 RepID=A0A7W7VN47_9ACTN|nr:serine/threonine-protein kinase [Streptosporangium saharense]MBB4915825.1 serine/threonine protein kinase [Streptosporangium saharense]
MAEAQPEGRRVASRYHLLEPIGRGGMGIVWRAHDEFLDREVAVKEVRYADMLGEDSQEDFNRRTKREARAAGRLTHPNVVVVHDVVEEDGRPWIVMQLVESRSLGKVIRQEGPLPYRRVAEIGSQVLEALRAAHAQGVLHRDVKPENVLLADDGRVVLTDFGIATLETETALTMTGIAGTPAFIPPERIKTGTAQRESDLWSLGATLYAAVEGKPPHDRGGALPTMHAVLNDEPEPPVHAGPLAPVLEGLLRKDPDLRMSYDEAARLLRQVAESPQERRQPARTAVMPAVAGEASAETDPGVQYRPEAVPATGVKLGSSTAEEPQARGDRPPAAPVSGAANRPAAKPPSKPPSKPAAKPAQQAVQKSPQAAPQPVTRKVTPRPAAKPVPPRPVSPPRPAEPAVRREPAPSVRPPVPVSRPETRSVPPAPSVPPAVEFFPTSPSGGGKSPWNWDSMPPLRRWLLLLVPVLVLIMLVAGYLGMRSGRAGGLPEPRPSGSSESSEAGGSGDSVGAADKPAETATEPVSENSTEPAESPSPSPTESTPTDKDEEKEKESGLPEGWRTHKDSNGFSVGLPKGWDVDRRSGPSVWFRGPDRVSYLLIEYTNTPNSDPKKDWEDQERYSRGNFPGYKRIQIEKVDYMKKAADWEFTWNTSSGKARVIDRGFVTEGGRGYAIYWHTMADEWDKNLALFKGFTATFSSKK